MPNSKKNTDEKSGSEPKLLSGGNPQIPKGEGDEPVQAYIAAMPGWKRSLGERLDELIVRTVPDVHKAVKWNQPFYGHEGEGWFLAFRCYTLFGHDHPCARASHAAAPRFSTEAVQAPARVNVTCVTPLGEEVASTS